MRHRSKKQIGLFLATLLSIFHYQFSRAQSEDPSSAPHESVLGLPSLGPDDYPVVQNGWYSFPPWAERLPFDLKSKLDIPPDNNREQLYCQVLAEWDPSRGRNLFSSYREIDSTALLAWNKTALERRHRISDFIHDRMNEAGRFEPLRTEEDFSQAERLLAPYRSGLEKLHRIGRRQNCFFHAEWLPSSVSHVFAGRDVTYILALQCTTELSMREALRCVETALQLKRDLVELGDQVEQIAGAAMERVVFDDMVTPILQRKDLTVPEIDQMIRILMKHDEECRKADLYLEATKREMLEFRHVMHLLATENFDTEERRRRLGLDREDQLATVVLREVVDYGFYRVNSAEVREEIESLARGNDMIRQVWEQVREDWNANDDYEEGARFLLGLLLSDELEAINTQSFERDVTVLNTRYRQVEEACRLPYPDSTQQLRQLQERWTLDDSWKQTIFVRWFLPQDRSANQRCGAQLRRNAYLTLAAIRRWQLQHDGQDPPDLKAAISAIGLEQVPVDTYSGKRLQLVTDAMSIGTYSIGPDGKDDQAKLLYAPFNSPVGTPAIGDLLFALERQ